MSYSGFTYLQVLHIARMCAGQRCLLQPKCWHTFESIGTGVVGIVLSRFGTSNTHFKEDPKADF